MIGRMSVTLALACTFLPVTGCGRGRTAQDDAAIRATVTLHVVDMTERQGLT